MSTQRLDSVQLGEKEAILTQMIPPLWSWMSCPEKKFRLGEALLLLRRGEQAKEYHDGHK